MRTGDDGSLIFPQEKLAQWRELSFVARLGVEEGSSPLVKIGPRGVKHVSIQLEPVRREKAVLLLVHAMDEGKPIVRTRVRVAVDSNSGSTRDTEFTDDSGYFLVRDVSSERTMIVLAPEGFAGVALDLSVEATSLVEREVAFVHGATVEGHVSVPAGVDPTMDIGLSVKGELAVTNQHEEVFADGTYRIHDLAPGRYALYGDHCTGCFEVGAEVVVSGPGTVRGPDLRFGDGARVQWRLLGADGAPVASASVRLLESTRFADSETGSDGRFVFQGARPGHHSLEVYEADDVVNKTTWLEFNLGDEHAKELGDVAASARGQEDRCGMTGVVVDELGAPVASAQVFGAGFTVTTDIAGRFACEDLTYLPPALVARMGASISPVIETGSGRDLTLRFARGGVVEGTVAPVGSPGVAVSIEVSSDRANVAGWILSWASALPQAEVPLWSAFPPGGIACSSATSRPSRPSSKRDPP
jgi:hypothetical protein